MIGGPGGDEEAWGSAEQYRAIAPELDRFESTGEPRDCSLMEGPVPSPQAYTSARGGSPNS